MERSLLGDRLLVLWPRERALPAIQSRTWVLRAAWSPQYWRHSCMPVAPPADRESDHFLYFRPRYLLINLFACVCYTPLSCKRNAISTAWFLWSLILIRLIVAKVIIGGEWSLLQWSFLAEWSLFGEWSLFPFVAFTALQPDNTGLAKEASRLVNVGCLLYMSLKNSGNGGNAGTMPANPRHYWVCLYPQPN